MTDEPDTNELDPLAGKGRGSGKENFGVDPDATLPLDAPTLAQHGSGSSGKVAGNVARPSPSSTGGGGLSLGKLGSWIGPYQLIEPLGEGGYGSVFKARQEQPIVREVALKIIKPGMDTKEVIARFEAERQVLALMDHPNIAKVLDAGATEHGRPYFVMELVNGSPVNRYCDSKFFTTEKRLSIFLAICAAIQHAHQKGIIHRDLKPNNILIGEDDDTPTVKVIDFGISKALSQDLTERTLLTTQGQVIGTPQYMSPEQAEANGFDIDTRTDIYSLGVVLYELLTGRTPLDPAELRRAGVEEICRLVREKEPVRPSTRLSTLTVAETAQIATAHGAKPDKLTRSARGDLDLIVMKALEKERSRRYQDVAAFADDIRNFLVDKPVSATPPSKSYRLGKFIRRNKASLTSVALIALALVIGTVLSMWQALVASQQRVLAEQSAADSQAVLTFFEDEILKAARPATKGEGLGIDATVFQAVNAAEAKISDGFADRPLLEGAIRSTLAGSYHEMGKMEQALEQYQKVVELRQETLGENHPDTLRSIGYLGAGYLRLGNYLEALKLHEALLHQTTEQLGELHPETLRAMHHLAVTYSGLHRQSEALALNERLVELNTRISGAYAEDTLRSKVNLANSYMDFDRTGDAESLLRDILSRETTSRQPDDPFILAVTTSLASLYSQTDRLDEALALNLETLSTKRKVLGPDHPHTLLSLENVYLCQRDLGLFDEAEATLKEAIALNLKVHGEHHQQTLMLMTSYAYFCENLKRWEEAEAQFRKVIELMTQHTPDSWTLPNTQSVLGALLSRRKQYDEAEPLLLAGFEGLSKLGSEDLKPYLGFCGRSLIDLYKRWPKPEKMAEWQAKLKELNIPDKAS